MPGTHANTGRHRRSVLDSATAAELSLANLGDDLVSGSGRRLATYISMEVRALHNITKFLKAMNQKLPPDIEGAITRPRNRAIHEGHEPEEATATRSLEVAEEVVDLAFPGRKLP